VHTRNLPLTTHGDARSDVGRGKKNSAPMRLRSNGKRPEKVRLLAGPMEAA
jgi:hypothetical protein